MSPLGHKKAIQDSLEILLFGHLWEYDKYASHKTNPMCQKVSVLVLSKQIPSPTPPPPPRPKKEMGA